MTATLNGQDGVEAIQAMMRLGASSARFDGRRVLAACRTALGRARLRGALAGARRARRSARTVRATRTAVRSVERRERAAGSAGARSSSPPRPRPAAEGGA